MTARNHNVTITNFNSNTTVCYSVILLKGEIITNLKSRCKINNTLKVQNNDYNYSVLTNLKLNRFSCLVPLKFGSNLIKLQYCCASKNISINFQPRSTEYSVVPIYIICKNHDGKFQSPTSEDNSIESACKRISLGTKLIQCLIAEKFYESNLERKTFQIETDINPDAPSCRIFHSNLDVEHVKTLQPEEIWSSFGRELMSSEYANEKSKFLAFVSCTQYRGDKYQKNVTTYEDIVHITEAHVALGGGGLAIFGSACLYTWPAKLEDVAKYFENESVIDRNRFMDDSCYRGTYGGCFATTLGSLCHELCHTFDLGHTAEGVMSRGFDEINKEFTLSSFKNNSKVLKVLPAEEQHCTVEFSPNIDVQISHNLPPNKKPDSQFIKSKSGMKRSESKNLIHSKSGIYWTRSCSLILYYHRWFNDLPYISHTLELDKNEKILKSSAGICVLEIRNCASGEVLKYWDFSDNPKLLFEIPELESGNKEDKQVALVVAEDIVGNLLKAKMENN